MLDALFLLQLCVSPGAYQLELNHLSSFEQEERGDVTESFANQGFTGLALAFFFCAH